MSDKARLGDAKKDVAIRIVRRLREGNYQAYFVGGCVRDLLLKKNPKDFDIATNATPDDVKRLFSKTVPVGAKFGVMLVVLEGQPFEVATFRKDKGYQDGRHPTGVSFTHAQEDAKRRDFTVNAIFYDPLKRQVLDWVKGSGDLKNKIIRAVGDPTQRFSEDRLRMLRAVRFASILGFRIEPTTLAAVKKLAPKIHEVSLERVRDELIKMFTGPNPALALTLLERTGLLKEVLPEVAAMRGVRQPRRFHPEGDVFRHTRLILEHLKNAPTLLAFSCLLHDVGKPLAFRRGRKIQFRCHDRVGARIAEKILARLRFPNDLRNQIITCIDGHMTFKDVKKMRVSTLKKFLRRATFESELEQHRLDCLASHGDLTNWRFLKKKMSGLTHEELRPAPLVNGHHLLVLGYKEGPLIGKILKSVEEAQLEKKISSKEEAIEWLKKKFKQKS